MTETLLSIRPQVLLLLVVPQRDKASGNEIHDAFLDMVLNDDLRNVCETYRSMTNVIVTLTAKQNHEIVSYAATIRLIFCLGKTILLTGPLAACSQDVQLLLLDALFYFPVTEMPLLDLSPLLFVLREKRFGSEFLSRLWLLIRHQFNRCRESDKIQDYVKALVREALYDREFNNASRTKDALIRAELLKSAAVHCALSLILHPVTFALQLMEELQQLPANEADCSIHGVLCLACRVLHRASWETHDRKEETSFHAKLAELLVSYLFSFLQTRLDWVCSEDEPLIGQLEALACPYHSIDLLHAVCSTQFSFLPFLLKSLEKQLEDASEKTVHITSAVLLLLLRVRSLAEEWAPLRIAVLDLFGRLQGFYRMGRQTHIWHRLSALRQHLFQ